MTVRTAPARSAVALSAAGRLWAPLLTFAICLLVALLHHFMALEPRSTFFADSRSYLETCRKLVIAITASTSGSASLDSQGAGFVASLARDLMHDGPVLPLMPAVFFAMIGKSPTPLDWPLFVVFGSCLHAASASLVCLLMQRLTNSQSWSLVAGLTWALYPAAIIASGRYLSEGPTALFLLAMLWSASKLLEIPSNRKIAFIATAVALGVFNGLVMLLKPALLPAWLGVSALAFAFLRGWKLKGMASAAMVSGLAIVIAPWVLTSKTLTGTAYLTPQRTPVYNVALGADTEADGWPARPNPPLTTRLSQEPSIGSATVAAWSMHPVELLSLTLRKVARLWVVPWNDFRVRVFGLTPELQAWWHSVLLILALPGALAVLSAVPLRQMTGALGRVATFVGGASILLLLGHFAYLPFAAIVRYAFTAEPYVIILASYAVFVASRWPIQFRPALGAIVSWFALAAIWKFDLVPGLVAVTGDYRTALLVKFGLEALLLALSMVMVLAYIKRIALESKFGLCAGIASGIAGGSALAVMAAFCVDGRYATEWSSTIGPGESVYREVFLTEKSAPESTSSATAGLVLDTDRSIRPPIVSVNGHTVKESPELLFRFRPSSYFLFDMMRVFAGKLHHPVEQNRQWRVVTFPMSWLNMNGANVFRLGNDGQSPITIYGDYEDRWQARRYVPSLEHFSAELLGNTVDGYEGRIRDLSGQPPTTSSSWLERHGKQYRYDLSAAGGRQIGQYRLLLVLAGADASGAAGQGAAPEKVPRDLLKFEKKLSPADFDPILSSNLVAGAELRMNKPILKAASRVGARVAVPEELRAAPFLRIKISGNVRAAKSDCITSVLANLVSGNSSHSESVLPATPPYLKAGQQWTPFEISEIVPAEHVPAGVKAIDIVLFPGAWEDVREYGCDRRCGDAYFKDIKLGMEPLYRRRLDRPALVAY